MITQSFDLNLIPNSAPIVVHCDQYDEGTERFIITLYDGMVAYTPASGATVMIQGTKPDGKGFQYDASISGNVVTANLTRQMTAAYGKVKCQIVVTESANRTGTFAFDLMVQKSALPADTDMSESEYQKIVEVLDNIDGVAQDAIDDINDAIDDAQDALDGKVSAAAASAAAAAQSASEAEQYAQGGLIYRGSILFANIPTSGMKAGDMYNMENDFTTDSRFQEGTGISVAAGTNIAWNGTKWDLLAIGGGDDDYISTVLREEIPSGSNLNEYKTAGNYYYPSNTVLTNSPQRGAFQMIVMDLMNITGSSIDVIQLVYKSDYNGGTEKFYFRSFNASMDLWSSWNGFITGSSPNFRMNDLYDASITSLSDGQVLVADSSFWKNKYLSAAKYDSSNTLADIIGDVETLLAAL